MRVLINTSEATWRDNLQFLFRGGINKELITDKNLDVIVYTIKQYVPFLLKKEIAAINEELSQADNLKIVFDRNVSKYIRENFQNYQTVSKRKSFYYNLKGITYKIQRNLQKEDLETGIISLKYDKDIFHVIDSLSKYSKTISIITNDDLLFEEASEYAWSKYGTLVNLKNFSNLKNKDLVIVLNKEDSKNNKFDNLAKYTVDMTQKYTIYETNCLDDFSSFNEKKLSGYNTKMCYFVENGNKISNLRWKISKKS